MTRRDPVLISTVTAMPGDRLTVLFSTCICVRRATKAGGVAANIATLPELLRRPKLKALIPPAWRRKLTKQFCKGKIRGR
jgi:hypothetical protein